MVLSIVGFGVGSVLMIFFLKEYMKMKKETAVLLETKGTYDHNNHSNFPKIMSGMGVILGLSSIYLGYIENDELNLTLGIIIALMFVGQFFLVSFRSQYWFNEDSVISSGEYIRYKSIKSIKNSKAILMRNYTITTYSGQDIVVSKETALYLSEKLKKSISK